MVGIQKQRTLRESLEGRQQVLEEARQALENDDGSLDDVLRQSYERILESVGEEIIRIDR